MYSENTFMIRFTTVSYNYSNMNWLKFEIYSRLMPPFNLDGTSEICSNKKCSISRSWAHIAELYNGPWKPTPASKMSRFVLAFLPLVSPHGEKPKQLKETPKKSAWETLAMPAFVNKTHHQAYAWGSKDRWKHVVASFPLWLNDISCPFLL